MNPSITQMHRMLLEQIDALLLEQIDASMIPLSHRCIECCGADRCLYYTDARNATGADRCLYHTDARNTAGLDRCLYHIDARNAAGPDRCLYHTDARNAATWTRQTITGLPSGSSVATNTTATKLVETSMINSLIVVAGGYGQARRIVLKGRGRDLFVHGNIASESCCERRLRRWHNTGDTLRPR